MLRNALLCSAIIVAGASAALAMGSGDPPATSNTPYDQAVKLVNIEDYKGAAALLSSVVGADPTNADAWNYLGYSERKLGNFPSALAAYGKALALQPEHRGANEYLGELYLQMHDLPKARERLAVLDKACWLPCDEYSQLKGEIEAYEVSNPPKSS